ncbi:hypothetical protein Dimus_001783 [Dionaea muscipula]
MLWFPSGLPVTTDCGGHQEQGEADHGLSSHRSHISDSYLSKGSRSAVGISKTADNPLAAASGSKDDLGSLSTCGGSGPRFRLNPSASGLPCNNFAKRWEFGPPKCGGVPLKVSFPRLFSIASNQNASLAEYLSFPLHESAWRAVFRYPLRAWQEELLHELLTQLRGSAVPRLRNLEDRIVWAGESHGSFSVRSMYSHFALNTGFEDQCLTVIWSSLAPPRA